MVDWHKERPYTFFDLVQIMHLLRSPGGCPWDAEQTHESIRGNILEEGYELLSAIDKRDRENMCEELGDLLLQVVFHTEIAQQAEEFDIGAVTDGICAKLIERHPHVFGETHVTGSSEVLDNWEKIKSRSKGHRSAADSLKAVTESLPALMKAEKLISRASKAGYTFDSMPAGADGDTGRALFSEVLAARKAGIDSELALLDYCRLFVREFEEWEIRTKKA